MGMAIKVATATRNTTDTKKHYGRYNCHSVSKWAYDDYGQKLKIGGTMCYDAYGQAYVVPGSRYLIHQY